MASVLDSIRSVITARFAFFKVLVLSGLLAYPLHQMLFVKFDGWLDLWPILTIVMLLYNIGFILFMVHNEVSDNTILIPGIFNPLKFTAAGLGALLFCAPMVAGMWFLGTYVYDTGMEKGISLPLIITLIVIIAWLFSAALLTQFILFSVKLNPFHAFNIVKVFKNLSTFLTRIISLLFSLLIVSIVTVSVGILVTKIFDVKSFAFLYYVIFILFFYLLIGFYYFGQIYMENTYSELDVNYDENAGIIIDRDILN